MDADLDLLLTAVYVTADDLLPGKPENARRSLTDAEVVTLCVAQAIMGIPSDRRFLKVAGKHLRHLFPTIPGQAGKAFAQALSDMNATILRPRRKDEPGHGPHLAPIRQRIESIFWSCKGTLTLECLRGAARPDHIPLTFITSIGICRLMSVDLELAPKTKRPAGERRCEPVVHPDVERAQALRMAEVAKALGDPIQWAYSYVIPDALKELSAWLS